MRPTLTTNIRPLTIIMVLRPKMVGEHTGHKGGKHAAAQHRGNNDGCLPDGEVDGLAQVKKSGSDNADIDAIEKAAQSGDEEQEP